MRGPRHIHFGPSKLALGLILPILFEVGMPTHLIGRPGKEETPAFGVSLEPHWPLQFYPLASFNGPRSLEELDPEIHVTLDCDGPLLITSTLREAILERHALIREILAARGPEAETVFIACENSPHPRYDDLRKEFEPKGVQFPSTVVNRICPRFLDNDNGRRIVRAHELGEWMIEAPSRPGVVASLLDKSDLVSFHSRKELVARERRKRWLVNGGQLYVALLAHEGGVEDLMSAALQAEIHAPMVHFHAEANRVLKARHPTLDGNLEYALDHGKAFCELADDVPRIVAMRRAELAPFLRSFERRIAEPARLAAEDEDGPPPEVFELALGTLDNLLEHDPAYDWSDPEDPGRPATLSVESDERAADAYAAMLTGWVPEEEIAGRRERLEIRLRSHRKQDDPVSRRIDLA